MHILNYFYKEKGLKIINLQLEYVYGPKDDDSKFIPNVIKNILNGKAINASLGMQKRDFIYVSDIVNAIDKAVNFLKSMDNDFITFEIGTEESISLRDFVTKVENLSSKQAYVNWGSLAYRKNEIYDSKADIKKAKKLLGWQPKYNLNEGLKKTIDWYIKSKHNG